MKTAKEIVEKINLENGKNQKLSEQPKLSEKKKKDCIKIIDEATEKMYAESRTEISLDFGEGVDSNIIFKDLDISYLIEKNGFKGIGCNGTHKGFLEIKR